MQSRFVLRSVVGAALYLFFILGLTFALLAFLLYMGERLLEHDAFKREAYGGGTW